MTYNLNYNNKRVHAAGATVLRGERSVAFVATAAFIFAFVA